MAMSGGAKSFTLDWPVAMLAAASMWRAADGNSLTSGTSSLLREKFHIIVEYLDEKYHQVG